MELPQNIEEINKEEKLEPTQKININLENKAESRPQKIEETLNENKEDKPSDEKIDIKEEKQDKEKKE